MSIGTIISDVVRFADRSPMHAIGIGIVGAAGVNLAAHVVAPSKLEPLAIGGAAAGAGAIAYGSMRSGNSMPFGFMFGTAAVTLGVLAVHELVT